MGERRSFTGCCGASFRVLKTWATFPRALRCILKLGMAQRMARLMTLEQEHTNTHLEHTAQVPRFCLEVGVCFEQRKL